MKTKIFDFTDSNGFILDDNLEFFEKSIKVIDSIPVGSFLCIIHQYFNHDGIVVFDKINMKGNFPEGTETKFVIYQDDIPYYFDTTNNIFAVSADDTQANTLEEMNENIYSLSLFLKDFNNIRFGIYFTPDSDNSVYQVVSGLSVDYFDQAYSNYNDFKKYCSLSGYDISAYSELDIINAIIRGTQYIESKKFKGFKTTVVQNLKWPRTNVPDKERYSTDYSQEFARDFGFFRDLYYDSNEIPKEIKDCNCECAYQELISPNSLQPALERGGRIASEALGPISTSYFNDAPSQTVYNKIRDYLSSFIVKGTGMIRIG